MKIKVASNFSFAKLINFLEKGKGLGETIDKFITNPLIEDSKERIRNNEVTPRTLPVTLKRRRARKSPKTISDSTLYDTGKLHDSIRLSDKRGIQTSIILKNAKRIEMEEYGKYHQLGMGRNKKREFLGLSDKGTLEFGDVIKIGPSTAEKASTEIMKRMVRSWKKRLAR